MKPRILFLSMLTAMSLAIASAQSPVPVVVPASTPAAVTNPGATVNRVPSTQDSEAVQSAIKMLEQIKAANEDVLRKQEATLQQLDEIQKAAEQLKIFSKRG